MAEPRTIETGTDHLLARVEDRVAILTMNRPERRNAFSNPMLEGLAAALRDAEQAADVGCVVLTGAGGAFCAGGECLDLEATHHVHTGRTRDHREATKAFVEKREPVFEGR